MNYRTFKHEVLSNQCRECLNRELGLKFEREDCLYLPYPELCSSCRQMRNIVADISRRKRWKILMYKSGTKNRKGNMP